MPRKKVEISSTTDLKKVKSTLYNMIRTSKKIDGRSFQKYINQVAAIKNKESNRRKLMDLYDVILAIDKSDANRKSTYQKVAEVKAKKNEAVSKIAKVFKKHVEPTVEFKNLDKAKSHIQFNLDQSYNGLTLDTIYPKLKNKIYNEARKLMTIKNKNIKLIMGCHSTWKKKSKDKDEPPEIISAPVKTKPVTVYSKDELEKVLEQLMNDLIRLFNAMKFIDSQWVLIKIDYIFLESYDIKPVRGSSYIPTPEKYSNAKCGLINIKNEDQECFKWCMKYHQSKKAKHDDRITVLKKLDDKYNYDGVNLPAGYDDIKRFENNNEIAVFVYTVSSDNEILREHLGNPDFK